MEIEVEAETLTGRDTGGAMGELEIVGVGAGIRVGETTGDAVIGTDTGGTEGGTEIGAGAETIGVGNPVSAEDTAGKKKNNINKIKLFNLINIYLPISKIRRKTSSGTSRGSF